MTQVADTTRIETIEYDGVKVTFNHGSYTATVVRCVGNIRVSTTYPMNWVADGSDVLEFIRKIKTFDQQAKALAYRLELPF
jgi:hypothetical protein